jgi:S-adenosylmethionine:tRNA ribosyltransferase-isomerase
MDGGRATPGRHPPRDSTPGKRQLVPARVSDSPVLYHPLVDTAAFDFDLPPELIAQEPPPERTAARLLVLDRRTGRVTHTHVGELGEHLAPGDLLAVNDTRVFPARLLGRRVPSGGAVECLLIGRAGGELWEALMHPGQKLKPGATVVFEAGPRTLRAEVLERRFHGRRLIRLWGESGVDVDEAIDAIGHVPLPPYIRRPDRPADRDRYQTVYARWRGSVAAPTAGLHFTDGLFAGLAARGIERVAVTLHVGYGTFKPVRVDRVEEHAVDAEWYRIDGEAARRLNAARASGRRVVAVGTTTTRVLESAVDEGTGRIEPGARDTSLFIYPGYRFKVVGALFTNFHLPRSSLLMMVAAFGGTDLVLAAYRDAVRRRYRFYSYGDAMLIL